MSKAVATEAVLSQEEEKAVHAFVNRATIPLLRQIDGDFIDLNASATLFEVAGRHFLVTAAHAVEDESELTRVCAPDGQRNAGIHLLGALTLHRPKDYGRLDVAALEIHDRVTVQWLSNYWRILRPENVSTPFRQGQFFLAGYPSKLGRVDGLNVGGGFIRILTTRLHNVPAAVRDHDENFDLYFKYFRNATDSSGQAAMVPPLKGASGAAVWQVQRRAAGIWTAENAVSVVGIQSTSDNTTYFRARRWKVLALTLSAADEALREALAPLLRSLSGPDLPPP